MSRDGVRAMARAAAQRLAVSAGVDALARTRRRDRLLVLCYHGLREDGDARDDAMLIPRARFEAQMRFVAAHYRVRPLDDAVRALAAGALDHPTACITFDDGYESNRTLAAPVLAALGLPATIFLVTGLIGSRRLPWPTAVQLALEAAPAGARRLPVVGELSLPGVPAARRAAIHLLLGRLKRLPAPDRRAVVDAVLDGRDGRELDPDGRFALMEWAAVRELAAGGRVTFGAHSHTHEILATLDDAALHREVAGSVEALRAALGEGRWLADSFAYPNGGVHDFDARTERAVQEAGLASAVSTLYGLNDRGAPRYALRRLVVGAGMSLPEFRLRGAGAWARYRG